MKGNKYIDIFMYSCNKCLYKYVPLTISLATGKAFAAYTPFWGVCKERGIRA
jgi:hypothetical protein